MAQPVEQHPQAEPDYARDAPTLAPLYELFRRIARRVEAEQGEDSSSEVKPRQ
jgi:hypothetical protein